MTGDLVKAEEAERIGLVNHVVPADQLMEKALAFATRMANGPRYGDSGDQGLGE